MKKKFPKKHLPPIEILLERLDYDPIKGEFYWKIDIPNNRIKKGDLVKGSRKKSHSNIYIYIGINGNQYAAQRLAWYIYYKEDPYPLDVDHINNNTLDNSIKNLQLLTTVENNKKKNIEAYLKDMEDMLIDCIQNDKDVYKVVSSSQGDEQTWRGMGISKEDIEKFQKFVDKMKKKVGKDITPKKDNKDK